VRFLFFSLVSIIVFFISGYAGTVDLPAHGREGGKGESLGCGDNKVLIGIRGYKGRWLDRLGGNCRKISSTGTWLGSTTSTDIADGGYAGGPTPPPQGFNINCPVNTMVKGMSGSFDPERYVTKISLVCGSLLSQTSRNTISVTAPYAVMDNIDDNESWSVELCPDEKPGRVIRVRSDDRGMRAVGLSCHSGTTPETEILAAPEDLVAINLVGPNGPPASVITPFVQLSWVDRSTYESGFQIKVFRTDGSGLSNTFDRPASSGIGSRQALNVTDLPGGRYTFSVCSKYSRGDGGDLCFGNMPFQIALAPTCSPTITSAVRVGAGTGRVAWSHTCTNPTNFVVKLRCGNSPFGTVASTLDGTARVEDFIFGVGSGVIQVCAFYTGQGEFCSNQQAFQCN
jgi:hypothetical protein